MTCPICISTYNKSLNSCVTCPDETCGYNACKECVRTYLLGTTQDPNCMNCHKAYDPEFSTRNLNVSWIKSTYRDHRKKLLLEREICRIPETMQVVDNHRQIRKLEQEDAENKKQLDEIRRQQLQLQDNRYKIQRNISQIRRGGKGSTERKQFNMPCPDQECRGFLSSAYKCGACDKYTCSKCHEIIGFNKTNADHVCNEDSVKSTELIKKETNPCPKCGERISKISGCDQMWCPECQTAFSWKTGVIDHGVVHNPHFYQWQRAGGGGAAPRNPGDVVCGGLNDWWHRRHAINRFIGGLTTSEARRVTESTAAVTELMNITGEYHRSINHIIHTIVNRLREDIIGNDPYQSLRVSYILKDISKEQLSATLVKQDNIRRKKTELLHVWELVQTVATENYNAYVDDIILLTQAFTTKSSNAGIPLLIHDIIIQRSDYVEQYTALYKTFVTAIDNITAYANERFAIISATFNCAAPKLVSVLVVNSQKSKQSIMKERSTQNIYPNGDGAV